MPRQTQPAATLTTPLTPPRPPAVDRVAAVLASGGEHTAEHLAAHTGLGSSTVRKALLALLAAGRSHRVGGGLDGGRRQPNRWSAVPADTTPGAETPSRAAAPTLEPAPQPARRLVRGGLAAQVAAYLQDHPDSDFGPVAVAKALGGRSAGAVGNALTKLTDAGAVVPVSDHPKRYRHRG